MYQLRTSRKPQLWLSMSSCHSLSGIRTMQNAGQAMEQLREAHDTKSELHTSGDFGSMSSTQKRFVDHRRPSHLLRLTRQLQHLLLHRL